MSKNKANNRLRKTFSLKMTGLDNAKSVAVFLKLKQRTNNIK